MKMKLIALIVVLCFGMVGSLFAGLTSGKGKVSGTVFDAATGQPLEGVTVKLFFPEVKQFHKPFAKTDKEGKWKTYYIRKGNWSIDFEKSGYETRKISYFVDPSPGSKNPPVEIKMKKMEGPAVASNVVKEIEKAKALMVEQKYDDALAKMLKILEENKEDPGIDIVNLYIGNCYALKGDNAKAINYYKKSLEKFPKHKGLLLSIGNAYNNLKDNENAMKWYSKLSIEDIGDVDTLYNIGAIAYNKGDYAGAAKYFQKATEVNPQFADGFYQLGMTLTGLNKQAEAVAALKKFMELAPDSPNFETAKAIVDAFK